MEGHTCQTANVESQQFLRTLRGRSVESELKVWQKERVPSRFDTRLWLYGLHGRVQSETFRFKSGAQSS